MEDLPRIFDTEQDAFCVELAKQLLNMQRRQDHLCDIALVTKDGKELKAHRNVLSAASPFFFKLLQSDMKENREGIFRFAEMSGAVMEDVLEFFYTGSVEVTQEKYTFCYLPKKDQWKRLADGLIEREDDTEMINYRNQLYAFPQ